MDGMLGKDWLPGNSRASLRSIAVLSAKIIITGTILWIVVNRVGVPALKNSLLHANQLFLFAAISLWLPLMISAAQRWRLVAFALGERLSFRAAFIYTWIGFFMSLGLPTLLGLDAVRVLQMKRQKIPLGLAARIVIVDRLCSFASLLLVIAMGIPQVASLAGGQLFKQTIISVVVCGTVGFALLASLHLFKTPLSKSRGLRHIWQLSRDFDQVLLGNRGAAAKILLWAICSHLCRVGIVICLAFGLQLELSPLNAFALVPASFLITMVPISLGGWGIREVVFVEVLNLVGIASANALALSILYGLLGLAIGLLGGAMWIAERRLS